MEVVFGQPLFLSVEKSFQLTDIEKNSTGVRMTRDLDELSSREFDLIIVGGGIYGAAAAWDATLRGLTVALVEQADFGSATSSNSLKIIHGGLRYIQHADVKRMRESIRERRILMTIAPHLVHPMPCLMPLYGHLGKGPEVMRIALMLNDLVGFDRNRIPDPQKRLPEGKVISGEECRKLLPGIRERNLSGGALWYDCHIYNSERMLISCLRSAVELGARVANYVRVENLIIQGDRVQGVMVQDQLSKESFPIRGRLVLNTSGPWVNCIMNLLHSRGAGKEIKLSWAMNLVTRKIFPNFAAGISGRIPIKENGRWIREAGKVFFVTPWREYSLVGTIHKPYSGDPNHFRIKESQIEEFLEAVNTALPGNPIAREEVRFFYAGLLPMDRPDPRTGEVVLTRHYRLIDHKRTHGLNGIVSVVGVKYTTARDVVAKAIRLVLKKLHRPFQPSGTASRPVFGGKIERFEEFQQQALHETRGTLPDSVIRQLTYNYGSEYGRILRYGEENPRWLIPIPGTDVLPAEVVHAVREEMACHLMDALWRRTELGSAGNPGTSVISQVAHLMAKELHWDKTRIQEEIDLANRVYTPAK